jgi:hypothetical protein
MSIDYSAIASGTTIATEAELPPVSTRAPRQANPFLELVKAAAKDGKRRDLPGRFSLTPYEGKKGACEAFSVVAKLKAAGRQLGVRVEVRRFDATDEGCQIAFKATK